MKSALTTVLAACVFSLGFPTQDSNAGEPNFLTEVRPILSDHCFACHGNDEHQRAADLRLDTAEGIEAVVVAMKSADSELTHRIYSGDADVVMPPPEYNKPLTDAQRKILTDWIDSGAEFQGHWAFAPPQKTRIDASSNSAIDFFVEQKIEAAGLTPNSEASPETLLRRVCLDLTGLPPTREQVERLAGGSLDYETLVDELLASPAFGQHFGRHWLDLVRYADTHGLHLDNYREMWPYRDWVIDAVNANMPFDQFIREQLAGDLLPDATLAQQIASGFNRLNVTTSEGGSIYDEVFARNVIDRTDAFGTIFLGLTTQCAVCHDHKFDPITQKDYYSLSAFFNSLDGRALDGNKKDHPPVVRVPNETQTEQLAAYAEQLASLRDEMAGPIETVDAAQRAWEKTLALQAESNKTVDDGPATTEALAISEATAKSKTALSIENGSVTSATAKAKDTHTLIGTIPAESSSWQTVRLTALPHPETNRAGVSSNGNVVLSEIRFATRPKPSEPWQPLKISGAQADIEQSNGDYAIGFAIDGKIDDSKGWAVAGHEEKGGRKATFALPELSQRVTDGHAELKIELHYQSKFAGHQFYGVQFELSSESLGIDDSQRVRPGPVHLIGPFTAESEPAAVNRKFASEAAGFKADQAFDHGEEKLSWTLREDWSPVAVHSLPLLDKGVTIHLMHQ
ncbi:MAG: DUF1549 domain-containing protein, partial [Planctomycetota bacterium]